MGSANHLHFLPFHCPTPPTWVHISLSPRMAPRSARAAARQGLRRRKGEAGGEGVGRSAVLGAATAVGAASLGAFSERVTAPPSHLLARRRGRAARPAASSRGSAAPRAASPSARPRPAASSRPDPIRRRLVTSRRLPRPRHRPRGSSRTASSRSPKRTTRRASGAGSHPAGARTRAPPPGTVAGSTEHPRAAPASVSTAGAAVACAARGLGSGDGWRSGRAEQLSVRSILIFSSFCYFGGGIIEQISFLGIYL
ncbi:hypothetical protein BS78_K013800 [Paspalum vaginatum]|uniref:Uncharacterized protein n=1 Tax=Paspalum vaginatum TaxID=158149 RepID=A0A9W7XCL4_9POAL|nr:hypothetical protein BS78_K013800 [Paspalum vaginatum]